MSNRNAMSRRLLAVGLSVGLCLSAAACGDDSDSDTSADPYVIAVPAALSGPAASIGEAEVAAAKAAAKQINDDGGVNGRQLKLVVKDTKSDPTETARVIPQLIRTDGVIAVFGDSTSSGLLAGLPIAAREKMTVLAPGSAADVTDPSKEWHSIVFGVAPTSANDNAAVRRQMANESVKTVGVIYQEDAANTSTSELFKKEPPEGARVVETAAVPSDATDTSAQVARIVRQKPDAIYLITSSVDLAASVARSLKDVGYDGQLYGSAGIAQRSLIETAGDAVEGMTLAALINPDDASATPDLAALLESAGGIKGFGSLLGANAIAVIAEGLKADPADSKELADAILEAGSIKGYGVAPMQYTDDDREGFPDEGMFSVRVENGKFVTLK